MIFDHIMLDDERIELPVSGFSDGVPLQGETTKADLLTLFGDIVADNGVAITPHEYDAVIARCVDRGWRAWQMSFEHWRGAGII